MKNVFRPDSALIERCIWDIAHNNSDSLKILYEQTSSAIYAYALSVTKNTFDAKDVLQDCLLKVYESAPTYKPLGKPMAWILTIAKNLCYTKFRQNARICEISDDDLERQFAYTSAGVEDKMVVKKCLLQLAEDERKIVVLHAMSGLKHKDIAKLMELPLSTVISKYNRALKKLKDIIGK